MLLGLKVMCLYRAALLLFETSVRGALLLFETSVRGALLMSMFPGGLQIFELGVDAQPCGLLLNRRKAGTLMRVLPISSSSSTGVCTTASLETRPPLRHAVSDSFLDKNALPLRRQRRCQ